MYIDVYGISLSHCCKNNLFLLCQFSSVKEWILSFFINIHEVKIIIAFVFLKNFPGK
jgi:hypothetical protein